ncbi:MAG: hypothetical protein PHR28_11890 [candidate division Zixibacteria bacterium]|nr:hypothetical protein [candidate division Zixibacteria bacterium]
MGHKKKNMGIITILAGIGILLLSIIFSSGYNSKEDFLGNILQMRIIVDRGEYVPGTVFEHGYVKKKEIAIPLKYPLSFSVLLIIVGMGIKLTSKNEETSDRAIQ